MLEIDALRDDQSMEDGDLVRRDARIFPGGQVAVQASSGLFSTFLHRELGER